MKTAISIDDDLLRAADAAARRLGINRSRFFAAAVSDFLERQRNDEMLRQLNDVYAAGMEPGEKRLLKQMKTKTRRSIKDRW